MEIEKVHGNDLFLRGNGLEVPFPFHGKWRKMFGSDRRHTGNTFYVVLN
jgi:hypothetical protein